ncbi:K02A2.6-like, partial [Cordylochernes scorpioides]
MSADDIASLVRSITFKVHQQEISLKNRHLSKLAFWKRKFNFPDVAESTGSALPNVLNLSSTKLSDREERILALGLQFIPPAKPDIPRIIAGIEGVTRSLNHLETLKVRNAAVQILSRPSQILPSNNRHRQIIKKLQSYKSLIFIKADKGSHTVVLDRSDYLSKMTDILQDNTTFSSISPQENLALTKSFRKALCEMKKSSIITPDQFVLFTSCLDREAYIYGLPKIHKPGVPLRPIIAYHLSPAYSVAKFLNDNHTVFHKIETISRYLRNPNYINYEACQRVVFYLNGTAGRWFDNNEKFQRELKTPLFKEPGPILKAANKNLIETLGKCVLNIEVNGLKISFEFVVMVECSHDIILGWDFFKATEAVVDCGRNELHLGETSILESREEENQRLFASDDFVIPPKSIKKNSVINEEICGIRDVLFSTSKDLLLRKEVLIPNSLVTFRHGRGSIWVANGASWPQLIPSGMNMCTMESYENRNICSLIESSDKLQETQLKSREWSQKINLTLDPGLSEIQRLHLVSCLDEFIDIFDFGSTPIKPTSTVKHKINTGDHSPIKQRTYRVAPSERRLIQDEVNKMIENHIVKPSESPWSSPVILFRKKDGTWRFWIEVDEKDREETVFITPDGLYKFRVMPFGLCNAPATFERMIDSVLGSLKWNMCLCYLDDTVVYAPTFEEHLRRLQLVLRCIQKAGLSLNHKKCLFGSRRINILGHLVDANGIHPDPDKVEAVSKFPRPKNISELRSFLGLCSYYRRFIENFADKARSLHDLLKAEKQLYWDAAQEKAFKVLKTALISELVLGHFDEFADTHLHTDASGHGIGAVLLQIQDGHLGFAQTYDKVKKRFYWPGLYRNVRQYASHCRECQRRKKLPRRPAGQLVSTPPVEKPFYKVGVDLGRFPVSKDGNRWIIVCTDYMTRRRPANTPFFLVHAREAETYIDAVLPYLPDEISDDYVGELVTRAEEARQLSRSCLLQSQAKYRRLYVQKHTPVYYQKDDHVWVFTPIRKVGLSEKPLKGYFGPYKVTKKLSEVTYEVEPVDPSPRSREAKDIVHVIRMKPYLDLEKQHSILLGNTSREVKPEGGDVGLINKFNTRQNKALAKICLSIGEEQQNHIRHLNSPKEVWGELQRLYAPRDSKHRILQLRRKLYSQKFCQHANMNAYLGSINLIVSELTGVGDKIEDGDLSMLILCGMPEDWDNVISTMCNLPESEFTSANIRRKLLAEAERRYATINEGMGALLVRNSNKKQFPHEHQGSKTVRKCFGCGKTGHIARDCFKLKKNNGKQQEKGAIHQHHEAKNLSVMYNAAVVSKEDTWVIVSGATHHMTPNRRSSKETQTLALVHCDLMGPFNIESWGGSRFVLTIIDDASRYTRVYFLKRKGDTLEKFKEWMKEAENQTGFSLKRIRTDNGLEFCSSPWDIFTKAHGIVHERTMVYTPEQNGVAERMNRTLLNLVRSTVNSCNLPTASWAELTNTAAYLRNRVTNRNNEEKTPFELWFGKRPALQHLRAIGCETFVHVPKQRRISKLQPRATKGILVGYSLQGRGWRIWIPEKRQVVESRNCVFKEEILYKQPKRERDTLPSVHFSSKEASFQEESNADQPVDRETEELIGTT